MLAAVLWVIGSLAAVATLCGLHWLCLYLLRNLIHHWRNAPTGGSAINPLQEFVQPQIRHVVEIGEQRRKEDDEGAPPAAARLARNQQSTDGT